MIGSTVDELDVWARPGELDRMVDRLRERGAVHNLEVEFRDGAGKRIDVLFSATLIEIGDEPCLLSVGQDITERKAFEEALEHQALHDRLTGLPNRSLFHDRLGHALERSEREGGRPAVLFLDLDRFKVINDSLGHPAGDRVLQMVADRLQGELRDQDTVARVGGDEFAVLLEGLPPGDHGIESAVDRIRAAFDAPFEVDDTAFSLSASVGAAHSGLDYSEPEELVRLADAAMYRVKRPGSTDCHVFDPGRDRKVTERLQREAALERAVEEDQLAVHYQPIYRLASGDVVGAEALVRWEHPERGLLPPGEFIALAEETGQIEPLGERVLRKALRRYRRLRERSLLPSDDFRISVNLSAREHEGTGPVRKIEEATDEVGVPVSALRVEITETIAMTAPDRFEALRRRGLELAVDDFGTGYASLEYLRHLTVDELKIDRSFVDHLDEPDRTSSLVRGILDMAAGMDLGVVAEGIETEEQLGMLREMGCPRGQGFLLAEPMPAADLEALLRDEGRTRPAGGPGAAG